MPFHKVRVPLIACLSPPLFFFPSGDLNVQNVPSAFQRWLSRAEQPRAKLCPVQSAEVKLTEMNTFYNYTHTGNTVGTAAQQSSTDVVCWFVVTSLVKSKFNQKHYWVSFIFLWKKEFWSDISRLFFCYFFCFCHEVSTGEPKQHYSYNPSIISAVISLIYNYQLITQTWILSLFHFK